MNENWRINVSIIHVIVNMFMKRFFKQSIDTQLRWISSSSSSIVTPLIMMIQRNRRWNGQHMGKKRIQFVVVSDHRTVTKAAESSPAKGELRWCTVSRSNCGTGFSAIYQKHLVKSSMSQAKCCKVGLTWSHKTKANPIRSWTNQKQEDSWDLSFRSCPNFVRRFHLE